MERNFVALVPARAIGGTGIALFFWVLAIGGFFFQAFIFSKLHACWQHFAQSIGGRL